MANSAQYTGINESVYNNLKQKLSGFGIDLEGNSGKVSQKGVSAQYAFDPATQTLKINDVNVSFPASMMFSSDKIIGMISEAVQGAGGSKVA
ncbi:hypothetical protein HUW51_09960 [Adhaeribacter swui]|uniref:Uncharacterized protein n=1 Tax=Adhaeribacter swui TaxID=2086471 RepID=A0A7G7G7A8_9BACT|nr:hypothetical protein [Adhaeribacter swui]QNF33042.1 hypothetical protein HUW51_09960 [Adhaeribacter swui]